MQFGREPRHWKRALVEVAVVSCLSPQLVGANPTAPTVVRGNVAFHQQGGALTVTNSPGSIINWKSFSIGQNESTRFIQQSAQSAVLNRVIDQSPSQILGALQSNGRVFIVNPSGIVFGPGSQVDVAGLVASSLKLSDADFLAGRLKFADTPGAGAVINQGTIVTPRGGTIYLIAPQVENSGIVVSPRGEVVLAAGRSVELVDAGSPNLRVEINAPADAVVNLGEVLARGGRVSFAASAIRQAGVVNADGAVVTDEGRILLTAGRVALEGASRTSASGPSGGSISVQADDTLLAAGAVEAKGSTGSGGTIHLLGDKVGLLGTAVVDASGASGGGTILAGGDFQGGNPGLRNASATFLGPDATLRADASQRGDGGRVIVWSDGTTRAYGTISARGGVSGGDGGFVEVSGKQSLDYRARTSIGAPQGHGGTLLLDPTDITLVGAGGTLDAQLNGTADPNILFADGGVATTLSVAELTAGFTAGDTIVLEASNNINVSTSFTLQPGVNLTLRPNADGVGGGAFNFSGGTIGIANGTLALSANTVMNWSNGDLLGTSVAGSTFSVPAGATVNITNSANNHRMNTLTVNNAGTWNVQTGNGTWQLDNGTQFNNLVTGVVDFQTDGSTIGTFTTGGRIRNQGIWKKSGGVGTTSFGATEVAFDNAGGSVSVTSGTLQLNSGGNHSGTTTLSGNVQFNLGTHAFAAGSVIDGPFNVSGATVNVTDATINGTFGLSGVSNVNIGTGTLALGPAATMNWSNGNLVGATVPGSIFSVPSGATVNITNSAVNHRMNTLTVNNAGTWNVQTGNATWQWENGTQFNNLASGVVDFQTDGSTIGTFTTGGRISNQGIWKKSGGVGTTSFGSTNVAFDNAGGTVSATSGTLQLNSGGNHSGSMNLSGNVVFNAGTHTFTGTVSVPAGSSLNVAGATLNFDDGSVFDLANNLNFTSGAVNIVGSGAGTTIASGTTLTLSNGSFGGTGKLTNLGTFNLASGNVSANLVNQGNVNVTSGTANFDGATFAQNGGTLDVSAGAALTKNAGTFDWSGGTLSGTGALTMAGGATFGLTGSGARVLNGLTLNVAGLTIPAGSLTVQAGALNAVGTTTVASGALLDVTGGAFNAPGATVNVDGTLRAGGGAVGGGTLNVNTGGMLTGVGTIAGNVVNAGTVAPGNSPGILTVDGNYTQGAGGTLAIEIGGLLPGVDYDRLAVTGTANLNGTLGVALAGGFTPAASDVFRILTAGAGVGGTFSTVTSPAGYTPNAGYLPIAVDLGLAAVVPPPPPVVVPPPPVATIVPAAAGTPVAGMNPERDVVTGLVRATHRALPGPVEGEAFDLLSCD